MIKKREWDGRLRYGAEVKARITMETKELMRKYGGEKYYKKRERRLYENK